MEMFLKLNILGKLYIMHLAGIAFPQSFVAFIAGRAVYNNFLKFLSASQNIL
jgi:hypothetical protein